MSRAVTEWGGFWDSERFEQDGTTSAARQSRFPIHIQEDNFKQISFCWWSRITMVDW
ncbi:unnamed protein product [Brassica rapa]|uniref:Uncharacterized protein n=2 Tax=Brassica TaxID=3705 RepID=A0A8D9DPB8_BRACM|nr:unnamed protein product [Brassica napus]CAG7877227.1 unnamed protein product [Brassica rapa]